MAVEEDCGLLLAQSTALSMSLQPWQQRSGRNQCVHALLLLQEQARAHEGVNTLNHIAVCMKHAFPKNRRDDTVNAKPRMLPSTCRCRDCQRAFLPAPWRNNGVGGMGRSRSSRAVCAARQTLD